MMVVLVSYFWSITEVFSLEDMEFFDANSWEPLVLKLYYFLRSSYTQINDQNQ